MKPIVALLLVLGLSPTLVFSQVSPRLCINAQGELRLIDMSGVPSSCPAGFRQIPFPRGPQGPRGPVGPQGAPGSPGGLMCWDLNGNGQPDLATEDRNGDGVLNALDCQGPQGVAGAQGPAGARGATGATGPQGPQGPAGPAGPTGPAGPPVSTSCTSQIGGYGSASTFCSSACNGSANVVIAVSNYQADCQVTSDTGRCSAGWGTGQSSYCCVCKP